MTLEEIKKSLTDEQIIDYLKHLGSGHRINNNNPNEIIFQTRCHHKKSEEMKYKLYYYKSSQSFYCYSSCGAIGDIFWLTGHILGANLSEATKYVLKYFNISNTSPQPYTEEDFEFDFSYEEEVTFQSVKLEDIEVEPLPPIQKQNIMRLFTKYYCKEWLNEGISKETMDKYEIKFSPTKFAIVIPHHNSLGEICGVRVRNLEKYSEEVYGKYCPLYLNNKMYNHKLGNNLYGLDKNKEAIKKFKKVQVFESEKSVLQTDTMFGDNSISVSICGSNFSRFQMKLLIDLGVEEVIMCLDKQYDDKESEERWFKKVNRMCKPLIEYGIKVSTVWDSLDSELLDYRDSPSDRGIKVFKQLVQNRIELKIEEDK